MKNKVYALSGEYIVKTGATLTIEEGVKIVAMTDDESVDYILVQQGAKIEAVGTKENPIIMTSDKRNLVHGAVCTSAVKLIPMQKVVPVNQKSVMQLMEVLLTMITLVH